MSTVTPEQVEQFQANGFLAVERISQPEEVERLRELYDDVMANPGALRLLYEGETKDGPIINQVFLPERLHPELLDTHYIRSAQAMAAPLLGCDPEEVTYGGLMFIYKPAGSGRAAPWHQDEAFWDDKNHLRCHSLSVWSPLDDVIVDSGAMQFIPGSHEHDVLAHRGQKGDPLVVDEPIDTAAAVACPLAAGGATFHHCRTLHHTAPNTSDRPRRAMTTIFNGPATLRDVPLDKPWNRRAHHTGSA